MTVRLPNIEIDGIQYLDRWKAFCFTLGILWVQFCNMFFLDDGVYSKRSRVNLERRVFVRFLWVTERISVENLTLLWKIMIVDS